MYYFSLDFEFTYDILCEYFLGCCCISFVTFLKFIPLHNFSHSFDSFPVKSDEYFQFLFSKNQFLIIRVFSKENYSHIVVSKRCIITSVKIFWEHFIFIFLEMCMMNDDENIYCQ